MDIKSKYDVLIIGGGYAGMEASLTIADAGFEVLLVEKEPSIGGHLIQISKVFPTVDCAGCIDLLCDLQAQLQVQLLELRIEILYPSLQPQ